MFTNQSPKRTNIEEANKHLQLLHERITVLEKQLKEKDQEAETNGSRVAEKLQAVTREKDGVIRELTQKIKTLESRVHVSQIVIKENEQTISALEKKAKKYEELCQFAPVLRNMLSVCEGQQLQSSISNGTPVSSSLHIPVVPSDQTPPSSSSTGSVSSKRAYSRPQLDASPTIQQMVQGYSNNHHFLISEDEMMDDAPPNVLARVKPEKELYL